MTSPLGDHAGSTSRASLKVRMCAPSGDQRPVRKDNALLSRLLPCPGPIVFDVEQVFVLHPRKRPDEVDRPDGLAVSCIGLSEAGWIDGKNDEHDDEGVQKAAEVVFHEFESL
jgi:hypothetical protein